MSLKIRFKVIAAEIIVKSTTLKHHTKYFLFLLIIAILNGCGSDSKDYTQHKKQLFTFGTLVDISILDNNSQRANQAIDSISSEFDRLHTLWHPWNDGALGKINQKVSTHSAPVIPPSIIKLIEKSKEFSTQSDGLFNPAIGQLIKLWQFDQLDNEEHIFQLPPTDSIQLLLQKNPQMSDIQLSLNNDNDYILHSSNPSIALDFGAFAKGAAIELMMTNLKNQKIYNALINAGGDLKVLGSKGDRPWRIGIKNPDYLLNKSSQPILAAVDLNNEESLFTSGNYERFFEYQGHHYHHIIDPRTGYPTSGTRSVTVLTKDAGLADAASTALFIAGPENWPRIARKMGIDSVMLIDEDNRIYLSPAMAERIELLTDTQPIIIKL